MEIHLWFSSPPSSLGRLCQGPCNQILGCVEQPKLLSGAGTDLCSESAQLSCVPDRGISVFSLFCSSCFLFLISLFSSQSLFSTVLQRSTFAIFQPRFLAVLGLSAFVWILPANTDNLSASPSVGLFIFHSWHSAKPWTITHWLSLKGWA